MAVELAVKYMPYVDEIFAKESKRTLITNQDFNWSGAHTIKVYKVSTSQMNDYNRHPEKGFTGSRYGEVEGLDATTEEMTLKKDRSFTYAIDKLDKDETLQQVDALKLTSTNIYTEILKANNALDNALVPETGRYIVVSPDVHVLMKQCKDITMETNIGNDLRLLGVISNLDGANVIRVPKVRLPENFGFMVCHPCATVSPVKLEDYRIHECPPGINGSLVEGRIVYDAFVLDNKKCAIYYQEQAA